MYNIRQYERTNEEFKYNFFTLLSWKFGVEVNYHWKRIRRFRIWRTPHVHLWHLLGFVMSFSQFRAGFLSGLLGYVRVSFWVRLVCYSFVTFPGWFHFGFVTSQIFFLHFHYTPFLALFPFCCSSIRVSFRLTSFCYISITVRQLCFSSVTTPLRIHSDSNKANFQFLPRGGFGCPCMCFACTFVWLCIHLRCFLLSLISTFSLSVL